MSVDRSAWRARFAGRVRRKWLKADIQLLESMVGRYTPNEMAARLGRPSQFVSHRLNMLGYRIYKDVMTPIGLTAVGCARRFGVFYDQLLRTVKSGQVVPIEWANGKDVLIRWKYVRRLEKYYNGIKARRARVLAKIKEPTINKWQLMKMLNLGETHTHRYLMYGIVKAWKVPCLWTTTGHYDGEWSVSLKDARRIRKLRLSGKLKLHTRKYRQQQIAINKQITQLRRERRLGLRDELSGRKLPPIRPGTYSVAQVAQLAKVSDNQVREHIRLGRLKVKGIPVGRRTYTVIYPAALPPYLKWCSRQVKATGPIEPRRRQLQSVHAAGRLTISDASKEYKLNRGTLNAAITQRRMPSKLIDGMHGLRRRDVAAYAKTIRRRK